MNKKTRLENEATHQAWETNARLWDQRMGDNGNDFFNILCWPVLESMLEPKSGKCILDVACGNGLTSRRLAGAGVRVTAFDFSRNLIRLAKTRPNPGNLIHYYVLDATDEILLHKNLAQLEKFDACLANMALFDMAAIDPLFHILRKHLKPDGIFVFSLMHPAFNNPSAALMAEEWDDGGIHTRYAVKVSRYMTKFASRGLALRNQTKPQLYFHRPLQDYLAVAFKNRFILDGFAERAFPPGHIQSSPLGWGGNFSEIPPVLVVRLRLEAST